MTTSIDISEVVGDLERRFGRPFVEKVEAGRVADFLGALEEPAADPTAPVPPLFLLSFARARRPQEVASSFGGVNAGDRFDFFVPVFIGDTITTLCEIGPIQPKTSAEREMLLIEILFTFTNQHGTVVARRTNKILRWRKSQS
ncbi:MaoC-like dehydratase domain-containing protein (plasmid) [Rhizobium gallicum]|uniref:MaoC-like dehydratase domain-containing protein n=1 Tax=Rhizobium gallicum TaxID=56730 RepID=A0A1L5NS43_9HYPH|nr:MaoC family dehydratase N-terminal domain-containing protein [Rhizobium gallicum]APO70692.1 MaoC-like dehydratase domain-containing protein [Rhizobium gallicum]